MQRVVSAGKLRTQWLQRRFWVFSSQSLPRTLRVPRFTRIQPLLVPNQLNTKNIVVNEWIRVCGKHATTTKRGTVCYRCRARENLQPVPREKGKRPKSRDLLLTDCKPNEQSTATATATRQHVWFGSSSTTGLPSSVCVVCCAFVIDVSVYQTSKTKDEI